MAYLLTIGLGLIIFEAVTFKKRSGNIDNVLTKDCI